MAQPQPAPIRGDVQQVCFPLLDAHVAKLEEAACPARSSFSGL